MRWKSTLAILVVWLANTGTSSGLDYESIEAETKERLLEGEIVLFPHQPDEDPGKEIDNRFVTMGMLLRGDRATIWEVINDKENADEFLDGVLESEILESEGNEMVAKQRTKVGGPRESYEYTLKYLLHPMERSEFSFVEGEIRNVEGGWWILEGSSEENFLVIYSLHIDAGFFAPQFVVKSGMKKSMPNTIRSTQQEVTRRMSASAVTETD
ncbi:MAG: SRPBCC family protein [Verrucomicrobiota bacterium]